MTLARQKPWSVWNSTGLENGPNSAGSLQATASRSNCRDSRRRIAPCTRKVLVLVRSTLPPRSSSADSAPGMSVCSGYANGVSGRRERTGPRFTRGAAPGRSGDPLRRRLGTVFTQMKGDTASGVGHPRDGERLGRRSPVFRQRSCRCDVGACLPRRMVRDSRHAKGQPGWLTRRCSRRAAGR